MKKEHSAVDQEITRLDIKIKAVRLINGVAKRTDNHDRMWVYGYIPGSRERFFIDATAQETSKDGRPIYDLNYYGKIGERATDVEAIKHIWGRKKYIVVIDDQIADTIHKDRDPRIGKINLNLKNGGVVHLFTPPKEMKLH